MAANGCLWPPMAAYSRQWLLMAANGRQWPPMAAYGCLWLPMAAYGRQWLLMAANGAQKSVGARLQAAAVRRSLRGARPSAAAFISYRLL